MLVGCVGSDDPDGSSVISRPESTASITASESASNDPGTPSCQPTETEQEPLIGPEVRAISSTGAEGWALIFLNLPGPPGDPLVIPASEEPVKIVWRLTGDGDVTFRATDPHGNIQELAWGPDAHGGSSWLRPGDEWGTGWLLDIPGCWTFEATRGNDNHTVPAVVSA